jgi:hypothetical protein
MQLAFGLQVGAWLVLWHVLFAFIKLRYPDSFAGQTLSVIV